MYTNVSENWWGRLYGYIKHAMYASGYGFEKKTVHPVKPYVTDSGVKRLDNGSEPYYESYRAKIRIAPAHPYKNTLRSVM